MFVIKTFQTFVSFAFRFFRPNTQFVYDKDCHRYTCECACNGNYTCPPENTRRICPEPTTAPPVCRQCTDPNGRRHRYVITRFAIGQTFTAFSVISNTPGAFHFICLIKLQFKELACLLVFFNWPNEWTLSFKGRTGVLRMTKIATGSPVTARVMESTTVPRNTRARSVLRVGAMDSVRHARTRQGGSIGKVTSNDQWFVWQSECFLVFCCVKHLI